MANYDVSIRIAIAGAKELDRVNKQTEKLRSSINAVNKTAELSGKKPVRNFNNLSKSVQDARDALDEAATGTKEFNQAVKNLVQVENKYDRQLKQRERRLKVQRLAAKEGISFSKAKILLLKQEAQAEAKLAAQKAKTARAERNKRIGGTISSAAIGGAFPLLFGQTGAAAVGGGLGGAAGGLIGGQFGFALSIVGTALGSAIDRNEKFNKSLAALNVNFSTTSGSTKILAADVDKLANRLGVTKEEAIAAFAAFKEFGSSSVVKSLVSIFGTDAGAFDTLAATKTQAVLAKQIFETRKEIGNEVTQQLLEQNLVNEASVVELALMEAKATAAKNRAVEEAKVIKFQDRILAAAASGPYNFVSPSIFADARVEKIEKEFAENRSQRFKDFQQALKEVRQLLGLVNEAQGQFGQSGVLAFSSITDKVKNLEDEMKKLVNPIFQVLTLSQTMATSFEESFKGIIKGTMSVSDAFRNMLNRIADHFLDTAAKMLANQFQRGILGLFSNMFGGFNAFNSIGDPAITGAFSTSSSIPFVVPDTPLVPQLANGGSAKGGKSYLVGERGPELFTPGVSGMVTPNHALGGSTNIVVNVDASGSSVEGDEEQGRELGRMISVAIQSELIKQKRPGGMLA